MAKKVVSKKKAKLPLSKTHPKLAKEAKGWDPSKITFGSNKKMLWQCKLKHQWEERVGNRTIKKYGCPICSGQKILPGFNDLATLYPKIAKEAHGWDPSIVARFSNQKLMWKCKKGHTWKAMVTNRTRRGDGCSVCSSHQTLAGFNDLASANPKLAKQAHGWDPKKLSPASSKRVEWKCDLKHTWIATVSSRSAGSGCPTCANRKVLPGFNDLASINPKMAKQAHGWDPKQLSPSSDKNVEWKCNLGHIWKTSANNRARGSECPICINQIVLQGFNDLATINPKLAKQANGWDPKTLSVGSGKRVEWKCNLGHIWKTTVALRTNGTQCPVCAGQKVWPGYNDLATTHPDIAIEAYNWDPTTIMAGSDKVVEWKCPKNHIWKVRAAARKAGGKCPICLGQRVLVGYNDLFTTHPDIALEAYKWDPSKITAGSGLKRKFKCNKGHIWSTVVGHRTSKNPTGCPTCAETGFDPNKDGYLYFIEHLDWEMLQIGITNVPDNRLNRHERLGWETKELRGPMDGHLTQQWETAILRMLKAKGADLSNSKIAGKFDGYSEAWSKSTFPVKSIKELMRLTEEFEEKIGAKK